MPFLPTDSTIIGECSECKYHRGGHVSNCEYERVCDPIGGTNYWHSKEFNTFEEMNNTVYRRKKNEKSIRRLS